MDFMSSKLSSMAWLIFKLDVSWQEKKLETQKRMSLDCRL